MTITSLPRSPQYLLSLLTKRAYSLPARRTLVTVSPEHAKVTVGIRREDSSRIWERRCPVTPDEVAQLVQHLDVNVIIQDCDRRVFPVDQFIKVRCHHSLFFQVSMIISTRLYYYYISRCTFTCSLTWYPSWAVIDHVLFQAGAKLHPTLEPAHIVVGIKETPLNELVTSPVSAPGLRSGPSIPRTHLMFSHTTKGQPYNMELLSRFLGSQGNPSLPRLIDYELLVGEDGKRTVGFGWFAGGKQRLKATSNGSPPDSCWCP
jgi:alpha-aminoadipic semialdehyde synthase